MNIDYSITPGRKLEKIEFQEKNIKPIISIISPYYNGEKYINQTAYCILNQTFPCWEWIIVDDGSKNKESLKKLDEISSLDKRIKVLHKKNEGPSVARDYGVEKSDSNSKYVFFLDADDLIEATCLECLYWTLETNPKASWAYTDSIGFEGLEYTWNKLFNSNKMKTQNDLILTSLIKKSDFNEVGGFGIKEKGVYEDWNLWLKMISKGKFPVKANFYGIWYRRKKEEGELQRSKNNHERAMEIVHQTASTIKNTVEAINYPKFDYDWDDITDSVESIPKLKAKRDGKINILMIIPWMVTGGADKFNLDLIKRIDKNKFNFTVITTEVSNNDCRQHFDEQCRVYDLTTFLDQKYWFAFVNYIIEKNNIDIVFNSNSEMGYAFLPLIKANHPETPIIDYVHMEEWYNRNGGYSRDSSKTESVIDKTLTCNENSRKILIDHFGRKPEETKTVYIGVDEKEFDPDKYNKEELKEKYNIPKDKMVVSYICRITEQKRPFLFLNVVKKLKDKNYIFLVVGDGNLLNKMQSEAKSMGLSDSLMFLGNIEETKEIYSISDMTINCSIKEGLALTAYESLSMGVPVISSDVGGQKELVSSDVGIIVPCMQKEDEIYNFKYEDEEINNYATAIEKITSNIDKYKAKCRKRILNNFVIDKMIENMTTIFEQTVKNPNEQKIENGKGLANNISLCKELITKSFFVIQVKYLWEIHNYNLYYGYLDNYKLDAFKEKMWKYAPYRALIKVLQKLGLIKLIKKLKKDIH